MLKSIFYSAVQIKSHFFQSFQYIGYNIHMQYSYIGTLCHHFIIGELLLDDSTDKNLRKMVAPKTNLSNKNGNCVDFLG